MNPGLKPHRPAKNARADQRTPTLKSQKTTRMNSTSASSFFPSTTTENSIDRLQKLEALNHTEAHLITDDDDGRDSQIANKESLIRVLDRRLLWICILIYLASFLSRINVGNIQLELLSDDPERQFPGMSAPSYSWAISLFFVGDVLSKLPSNLMLKRIGARSWLAVLSILVGLGTILSAFTPGLGGVPTWIWVRSVVGLCHGGVFPGLVFFLTRWYRPEDLGFRNSILFSASLMASATSGLMASLIVDSTQGWLELRGWQWFMIIEGFLPITIGILTWFVLPDASGSSFLKEDQKLALSRYLGHKHSNGGISSEITDFDSESRADSPLLSPDPTNEDRSAFVVQDTLLNPVLWLFCFFYLLCGIPNAALQLFLPAILKSFNLSQTQSNLSTVPIFMLTALFSVYWCTLSDAKRNRPLFLFPCFVTGILGFLGLALFAPHTGLISNSIQPESILWSILSLVLVFMASLSVAPLIPLTVTWLSTFIPSKEPSAIAIGSAMMVMVGQFSGILIPFVYTALMTETVVSVGDERDMGAEQVNMDSDSGGMWLMAVDNPSMSFMEMDGEKGVLKRQDYSWAHLFVVFCLFTGASLLLILKWLQSMSFRRQNSMR